MSDPYLERLRIAWETLPVEVREHSLRVASLAVTLGSHLGLPVDILQALEHGAVLHDIGKAYLSSLILDKDQSLSPEEKLLMRQHPTLAMSLMTCIPGLQPSLSIVLHHHERWDGFGYPARLKGKQIPLPARILAAADVWDALRSWRPYRPPWDLDAARAFVERAAGTQFDPAVIARLLPEVGSDEPTALASLPKTLFHRQA